MADTIMVLAEGTVLPETFQSRASDELATRWKGTEPEIALSQPWISSAPITVRQELLARFITGLSLHLGFSNCPRTDI